MYSPTINAHSRTLTRRHHSATKGCYRTLQASVDCIYLHSGAAPAVSQLYTPTLKSRNKNLKKWPKLIETSAVQSGEATWRREMEKKTEGMRTLKIGRGRKWSRMWRSKEMRGGKVQNNTDKKKGWAKQVWLKEDRSDEGRKRQNGTELNKMRATSRQ